jgi:hypothetical protein
MKSPSRWPPALVFLLLLPLLCAACARLTERAMYASLGDDDSADDDDSGGDDDSADDDDSGGDDDSAGDDDTSISDCDLSWLEPTEEPVSFSGDLLVIFLDHCSDCHTLKGLGKLTMTALEAYDQLVGVPNILGYGEDMARVEPGDPQSSYMIHKIIGCGPADPVWGFFQAPMPPPVPDVTPLEPEQISLIYSWIAQGAENN